MSKTFWFAAGAVSGVYTLVKAKRTVENFTPDGVGARLAAWSVGARLFADEVAAGMAEREAELRDQLRVPAVPAPQITASPAPLPEGVGPADGHR